RSSGRRDSPRTSSGSWGSAEKAACARAPGRPGNWCRKQAAARVGIEFPSPGQKMRGSGTGCPIGQAGPYNLAERLREEAEPPGGWLGTISCVAGPARTARRAPPLWFSRPLRVHVEEMAMPDPPYQLRPPMSSWGTGYQPPDFFGDQFKLTL